MLHLFQLRDHVDKAKDLLTWEFPVHVHGTKGYHHLDSMKGLAPFLMRYNKTMSFQWNKNQVHLYSTSQFTKCSRVHFLKSYLFLRLLWEVVRAGTDISILHMKKLRLALKKGVKRGVGQLTSEIKPPSHYRYQLGYIRKIKLNCNAVPLSGNQSPAPRT